MNKICFIVILICFTFSNGNSQNLVINPSFEDYYNCPIIASSILECKNVFNPVTSSTSDYFNSCAPVTTNTLNNINVPYNWGGFQKAYEGNAYLGFFSTGIYYQEYVQIKLSQPLVASKMYNFTFNLSLADQSSIATSAIDLKFVSDSTYYSMYPLDTYLIPDWSNPKGNFLTDTSNWIPVNGTYVAKGNEQWIIVGSFHNLSLGDTIRVNNGDLGVAYYYLDGFTVEEKEISIPNIFTPNGEGTNDIFFIKGLTIDETIFVYNRWGEEVISFKGNEYWNGRTKYNTLCNDGVYYCVINSTQTIIKTSFIHTKPLTSSLI